MSCWPLLFAPCPPKKRILFNRAQRAIYQYTQRWIWVSLFFFAPVVLYVLHDPPLFSPRYFYHIHPSIIIHNISQNISYPSQSTICWSSLLCMHGIPSWINLTLASTSNSYISSSSSSSGKNILSTEISFWNVWTILSAWDGTFQNRKKVLWTMGGISYDAKLASIHSFNFGLFVIWFFWDWDCCISFWMQLLILASVPVVSSHRRMAFFRESRIDFGRRRSFGVLLLVVSPSTLFAAFCFGHSSLLDAFSNNVVQNCFMAWTSSGLEGK